MSTTKRRHIDPRIRYGAVYVAIQNVQPGDIVLTEDGPFECFCVVHDGRGWSVYYSDGTVHTAERGRSIRVKFPRPGYDRNGKALNP